eukprot:3980877-Amphidinium_carterae.1
MMYTMRMYGSSDWSQLQGWDLMVVDKHYHGNHGMLSKTSMSGVVENRSVVRVVSCQGTHSFPSL